MRLHGCRSLALASAFILSLSGHAQTAASPGAAVAGAATFPAWDSFADQLHQLGDQLIAHLPERLRGDPQVVQEAGRVLLEAAAAETIQAISADPDYPVFLPSSNITFDSSQPNADTTYETGVIASGGQYRLLGLWDL